MSNEKKQFIIEKYSKLKKTAIEFRDRDKERAISNFNCGNVKLGNTYANRADYWETHRQWCERFLEDLNSF